MILVVRGSTTSGDWRAAWPPGLDSANQASAMKRFGSALLLCGLLLGGCSHDSGPTAVTSPEPPPPTDRPLYAPGRVIVGFYDDVDGEEAGAMVARFGLDWTCFFCEPQRFFVWVEVVSGDPAEHARRLSESTIVAWANVSQDPHGPPYGAMYLIVTFNESASVESAHALINSDSGLRLDSVHLHPKYGLVRVEPGAEQHWIEVLQKEPIVRYATFDYYMYPT